MKVLIAATAFLALGAALSGCGSDSKTSTTPAASVAAPTKAAATTPGVTAAATKPSASPAASAAAATSAPASSGDGDTCKYLSPSEAAALLPNPGPARAKSVDTPAAKQTSCNWGNLTSNGISIIVSEIKNSAAVAGIKANMDTELEEKIDSLGDAGGFTTKSDTSVSVTFIKGSTQVSISVAGSNLNADAVAAAAKKIAGTI